MQFNKQLTTVEVTKILLIRNPSVKIRKLKMVTATHIAKQQ